MAPKDIYAGIFKRNKTFVYLKECPHLRVIFRGLDSDHQLNNKNTCSLIYSQFDFHLYLKVIYPFDNYFGGLDFDHHQLNIRHPTNLCSI